jgi:hypothetical protein
MRPKAAWGSENVNPLIQADSTFLSTDRISKYTWTLIIVNALAERLNALFMNERAIRQFYDAQLTPIAKNGIKPGE